MNKKKPDQVVYNEESGRYDAFLRPYGTDLAAPFIDVPKELTWKSDHIREANSQFQARFNELRKEYQSLKEEAAINKLVYDARVSFSPVVGETYHLYRRSDAHSFLSILRPDECDFDHLGSFRLTSNKIWQKIAGPKKQPNH